MASGLTHLSGLSMIQVARLTHSISILTEGMLMMKTTLVGIIKVCYWHSLHPCENISGNCNSNQLEHFITGHATDV